ncbi:MAG: nucleotidyltransferase family protein [Candidatus Omnitrophica bacterium]|nr:nucleotidyltransferase family protein [Candidatus Omnitrophota bacterium]
MKALILAAGYATRLYPYTKDFPKPLLPLNGKPLIQYLIEKLQVLDNLDEIIIVTNNCFFSKFQHWKNNSSTCKKLKIINDLTTSPKQRRGAVGDMHFVLQRVGYDQDYLILGGDNFFEEPLYDFVFQAAKRKSSVTVGVLDIGSKTKARNYGVVKLADNNRVIVFQEKPRRPLTSLVAMCLYYFPSATTRLLDEYIKVMPKHTDNAGAYLEWLTTKGKVYAFIFKKRWFDIGSIKMYKSLRRILEQGGVGEK